jgi:hypothetical protein
MRLKERISSPGSTGGSFPLPGKILIIILPTNPSEPIVATASFFYMFKNSIVNNHIHFDIGIVDHFNAAKVPTFTWSNAHYYLTVNHSLVKTASKSLVFQTYFAYHQ